MRSCNLQRNVEAEAGSLAYFLGGKKGIKDVLLHVAGYAGTVVDDANVDCSVGLPLISIC